MFELDTCHISPCFNLKNSSLKELYFQSFKLSRHFKLEKYQVQLEIVKSADR